jgi:hypothetical protein
MENDLELVREVENALHVDIIPGTEIMAQDGAYSFVILWLPHS